MIVVSAMSQYNAQKAVANLKCKTAIISISGKYSDDVKFEESDNLVDVLRLHFKDYDVPDEDAITKGDAKKIAAFLEKNMDKINRLIVHCGFGTSRSVGIAAAIVNTFRKNEGEMVRMMGESGNKYCYRLVSEALKKHFKEKDRYEMQWSKKCIDCRDGELCRYHT